MKELGVMNKKWFLYPLLALVLFLLLRELNFMGTHFH